MSEQRKTSMADWISSWPIAAKIAAIAYMLLGFILGVSAALHGMSFLGMPYLWFTLLAAAPCLVFLKKSLQSDTATVRGFMWLLIAFFLCIGVLVPGFVYILLRTLSGITAWGPR